MIEKLSDKILFAFRAEQQKRRHFGCCCNECQEDMLNAVKNVLKEIMGDDCILISKGEGNG